MRRNSCLTACLLKRSECNLSRGTESCGRGTGNVLQAVCRNHFDNLGIIADFLGWPRSIIETISEISMSLKDSLPGMVCKQTKWVYKSLCFNLAGQSLVHEQNKIKVNSTLKSQN